MLSSDPPPGLPLQFETADGFVPPEANSTSSSLQCAVCSTPLPLAYHEWNGQAACAVCRAKAEAEYERDARWSQMLVAATYGFGAAIAGTIGYWAFVKITDIQLGIVAIAIGWLVGKAVMKGSNGRGGRRYQVLAVLLTYFSITASYGILIIGEAMKPQNREKIQERRAKIEKRRAEQREATPPPPTEAPPAPAPAAETPAPGTDPVPSPATPAAPPDAGTVILGIGYILLLFLAAPFLGGFSNIIGILIIGLGLWEAWKHTRQVPFLTGGPYEIAQDEPKPALEPQENA